MKKSELRKLIKNLIKEQTDPRMTGYGMRDFRRSKETSDPSELYENIKGVPEMLETMLDVVKDSDFEDPGLRPPNASAIP